MTGTDDAPRRVTADRASGPSILEGGGKLSGEARAAYGILAVIFVVPVVAVIAFVAMVLWPRDFHRVTAETPSPDGRAIVRVLLRDDDRGGGAGDAWAEVVVERPRGWLRSETRTVWSFGLGERGNAAARIEWRDPSHAIVRFRPETAIAEGRISALGIEVEIVREAP